jgi:Ca2+-transporting ATPase
LQREEARWPPQVLHFDRSVARVLDMYQTDAANGLAAAQRASNRTHYGANVLPQCPPPSWHALLWGQLNDFVVWLLLLTSILSLLVDYPDVTSSLVLLVVVVVNVGVGLRQSMQAQSALAMLERLQVSTCKVVFDGRVHDEYPAASLVPGDVVLLEEGDRVPADLRLIASARLLVDERVLTGESEPVGKQTHPVRARSRRLPCASCTGNVFMGTAVVRGGARGVVVRIGAHAELGRVSLALQQRGDAAGGGDLLQRQLGVLGRILVAVAVPLCAAIFAVSFYLRRRSA